MWFSRAKDDVHKNPWRGEIETKTEIEPRWHAATQVTVGRITSRRESSADLCYYFIYYYYTLIRRVPRRGREPQGVQTTRAWRWHCVSFGPRRWRARRSTDSNEKSAFIIIIIIATTVTTFNTRYRCTTEYTSYDMYDIIIICYIIWFNEYNIILYIAYRYLNVTKRQIILYTATVDQIAFV